MYFEGFIHEGSICSVRNIGGANHLIRSRTVFVRFRYPGVSNPSGDGLLTPGYKYDAPTGLPEGEGDFRESADFNLERILFQSCFFHTLKGCDMNRRSAKPIARGG